MIDFTLVDTHLHLWDTHRLRYPWLDENPTLNRPHALPEFQQASRDVPVGKMVFLQCDCLPEQARDEVIFVDEIAQVDPRLAGIVPFAPLEKGAGVEMELALLGINPAIKGIRRILQSEPDPEFCLRPDFVRGVQTLADFGLHFEICIVHPQLPGAIRLVEQCPNVRFILDHIGKPDIKNRVMQPWADNIRALAAFPNVECKISGMATEADPQTWTRADLQPYFDHVVDCFGVDRVMFGSDWPVSTLATTYKEWVEMVVAMAAGWLREDLVKLFAGNALRFYRL